MKYFFIPVFCRESNAIGESAVCPSCGCNQIAVGTYDKDTGIFHEYLKNIKVFLCTFCGLRWE